MQKKVQHNEVYEIAKKITAITDEEQQDEMLDSLGEVISKHFEENNSKPIEDAISKALNEQDLETTNIIMDEAYLEIETLQFEDKNNIEFDSTMQIMPCTIVSGKDSAVVPSINHFESIIRKHLLESQIIEREDQFHLGSLLLSEEELNTFNFQDWWNIHRGIIEKDQSDNSKNLKSRDLQIELVPDGSVSLFCLVPVIVDKDDIHGLAQALYESYVDIDTWAKIGAELSSADFKINVFPPIGISEAIQESTYIIQNVEFGEFFDEYAQEQETEIGYMQIADDPNEYIVLFFDGEDQSLQQFYQYGTQGDSASFVTMLIEKCIQNNYKTLFSFEEKISMDTLETWRNSPQPILITKLLKQANAIDLDASYRMSMINNPMGDTEMDSLSKKRTIH